MGGLWWSTHGPPNFWPKAWAARSAWLWAQFLTHEATNMLQATIVLLGYGTVTCTSLVAYNDEITPSYQC